MTIALEPQAEKVAPAHPLFAQADGRPLLYHQLRTALALQQHDAVVNTYPTGTGKTLGAQLYLLDPAMAQTSALVIAPTNAILDQHARDIQQFVAAHGLKHVVVPITAARVRQLSPRVKLRPGEVLARLIDNPREFLDSPDDWSRKPLIMVVNPDIFYYALFYQYNLKDQRNLFAKFLSAFRYLVIDEFHYYDSKQLACFFLFFTLWEEWGYFDDGRKVCLLSATPTARLQRFLDRIFDPAKGRSWELVAPENESTESAAYPTVPTLAPVELEVSDTTLLEWVKQSLPRIREWHRQGLDIALISSSLSTINQVHHLLTQEGLPVGRITGPVPEAKRRAAAVAAIILATPTVDLGYNFERHDKPRQPIDVVVFDARFSDEAVQRLGRAGRVLGRLIADQPSRAVALLPEGAALKLRAHEGTRLSRTAFNGLLRDASGLPPKHDLYRYLAHYGLVEVFYPLGVHTRRDLPSERAAQLERLFTAVRDVFAPASSRTQRSLAGEIQRFRERQHFVEQRAKDPEWLPSEKTLRCELRSYFIWARDTVVVEDDLTRCAQLLTGPQRSSGKQRLSRELEQFIREQHALTRSLFNFRDAFSAPSAVVYDPDRLLSDEIVNRYDLFHLLEHYEYQVLDRDQFGALTGETVIDESSSGVPVYLRLRAQRRTSRPLMLTLAIEDNEDHARFTAVYTGRVVTRTGFRLQFADGQPLPAVLADAICGEYCVFFALPKEARGRLIGCLRQTPYAWRELRVSSWGDPKNYVAVFGTAAFHVDAEFGWLLRTRKRRAEADEPIVC